MDNDSTLTIKCFDINEVKIGSQKSLNTTGELTISLDSSAITKQFSQISAIDVRVIKPDQRDVYTNTIMDFVPLATKVTGKLGTGITHVLTGVTFMLTGVDEAGKQCHEFGSSEGILKEQVAFDHPASPDNNDIIIAFDVTLKQGMGQQREGVLAAHSALDCYMQEYREQLKLLNGFECSEKHTYTNPSHPGKPKVVLIRKLVGQGAMSEILLFPNEPFGVMGGTTTIDLNNMPVFVTANEYRDGVLHSMH